MPDDETAKQPEETPATDEAQTEAIQAAENATEIAIEAESEVYALASYVAGLEERIVSIEGRLSNDERNNTELSAGNDDTGIGRLDDIETETPSQNERGDSRPVIKHWWYGKR